jgi:hypothetical protein
MATTNDPKVRALARAETAKAYLEKKYSKMKQVHRLSPDRSQFLMKSTGEDRVK